MTEQEQLTVKLDIAIEALRDIAAYHLPEANTIEFWMARSIDDSLTVIAQDTDLARTALKDMGVLNENSL